MVFKPAGAEDDGSRPSQALSQSDSMQTLSLPGGVPFALLTLQEVARALRVSQITVRRLVERRVIPCFHVARRLRFKLADVESYLASRAVDAPSSHGSPQDS